jgi:hypothetical protein
VPAVDGICAGWTALGDDHVDCLALPKQLGLLRTQTFGVFDVKDAPSMNDVAKASAPVCQSQTWKTIAWASTDGDASAGPRRVRALLQYECGLVCNRDGLAPFARGQLLVYDAQGKLDLVVEPGSVHLLTWTGTAGKETIASARLLGPGEVDGTLELANSIAAR